MPPSSLDTIGPIVHITSPEKRAVIIQFRKDNPHADTDVVFEEYLKFIRIKMSGITSTTRTTRTTSTSTTTSTTTCIPFAPSPLIDKMWHAHILSTREYQQFCERHNNGNFIHHDPTMNQGQRRYELTLQAYRKFLGEPNVAVWPKNVDGVARGTAIDVDDDDDDDTGRSGQKRKAEELLLFDCDDDSNEGNTSRGVKTEGNANEEEGVSNDSDKDSDASHASWYYDDKGYTKEGRIEWHKDYSFDGTSCEYHAWEDGEYDIHCEDCRIVSSNCGYSCG